MRKIILASSVLLLSLTMWGQTTLNIQTKKSTVSVNPDMYGIFFEDINFGADGGLYAELVKNRSFDFPQNLMGWNTFGNVSVQSEGGPFSKNPNYVRLLKSSHPEKHTGLENEGFRGMGFSKGATYRFSVYARAKSGEQKIRAELIDEQNDIVDKKVVVITGSDWKKYQVVLTSNRDVLKGRLRIFFQSGEQVDLEHISLFPTDTWKGRENGLRKDLAQALADLHPGVFRFPGGCIVEGTDLNTRYQWKNTVGPVENRPLNENRWHYTFPYRFFPDYFQTYGLGFYEFFQLAEEIGAAPLPVLSVGLSCQFQNKDPKAHVPVAELNPYVQDALDLIEFANGDSTSKWGKVRADMGHPKPFGLKYLAIGNEQWGKEYPEHLEPFITAIRAKYPNINILGSAGPFSDGKDFDYLWPEMRRLKTDLVDEHYYKSPDWFFTNATRYDKYDRKGPKVFAGEYASHDESTKKANNYLAALSEAAFMTGLERNADVVRLATYAPLFAHVDAWQWNPDLIWFDNLKSMRTPNWHVQQLYSRFKGTDVLSTLSAGLPLTGQNGLYASSVKDAKSNTIVIKIVNKEMKAQTLNIVLDGFKQKVSAVKMIRLQNDNLKVVNTVGKPDLFIPEESDLELVGSKFEFAAAAQSFTILVIQLSDAKVSDAGKQPGLHGQAGKPTVFTIGDSTVKNGDGNGSNGQWGWGAYLGDFLNSDSVTVVNRGSGGRSSRTYIDEGYWDKVKSALKPGDYVIMQFGHNDGIAPNDPERPRGTLRGNGDEAKSYLMPTKDSMLIHTYGWYMRKYILEARALGATPIVCSLIPRNDWRNGKIIRSNDSYGLWAKQAAEQTGAYFIDLNNLVSDKYEALGQDFVASMFYGDHTHTSQPGAKLNAFVIANSIKSMKDCKLSTWVK
jgi:alpha-L-arabinofuranosidase/lysophospholipase L1-like esterase